MKEVSVSKSHLKTLVDDEDYERVNDVIFWESEKRLRMNLNGKVVSLAAFIMNDFKNMYDHKDRNFLNNQKNNLRKCNKQQNAANQVKYKKKCSSKYKGVCWNKQREKWIASISVKDKNIYLGLFLTEVEAALAYNEAAIRHYGEFACINEVTNV